MVDESTPETRPDAPTLVDNAAGGRFELRSGEDVLGYADYSVDGDVMTLPHTVVDEAHSGKGHAGTIASGALDAARERGLKVRPVCPYIASYITRHPEYGDLVA